MECQVMDSNFRRIGVIDQFNSFIWTDRYDECGDFELVIGLDNPKISILQPEYYLRKKDTKRVMIIEDHKVKSDDEHGGDVTVTGRSLESILNRRIIWTQTILSGDFQNGIKSLLTANVISPSDTNRQIPNFVFDDSTDPYILGLDINAQCDMGANLYDTIKSLVSSANVGFKITFEDDLKFHFALYYGADRSYDQVANPRIIFSQGFDNLHSSNHAASSKTLKTFTLIGGDGDPPNRKTATTSVSGGGGTGLSRKEIFTDASSVSSKDKDGKAIPDDVYRAQLVQKGIETLSKNVATSSFDGQTDMTKSFVLNKDFFLGDIVQISTEYGVDSKVRVTEIINSQAGSGEDTIPTLKSV